MGDKLYRIRGRNQASSGWTWSGESPSSLASHAHLYHLYLFYSILSLSVNRDLRLKGSLTQH